MSENNQNPIEPDEPMEQDMNEQATALDAPVQTSADKAGDADGDSAAKAAPAATGKHSNPSQQQPKPKTPIRAVDIVFGLVAIIAIAVAVWSFVANGQPSGAAAKVNDTILTEDEVTEYIEEYRDSYGMSDDSTWAYSLQQQSTSPNLFRNNVIGTLATNKIIEEEANKLNVTVSDEDIDNAIQKIKDNMSITDDDTWQTTLSQYGTTEEQLREQEQALLLKDNLYDAAVPKPDGYDEAKTAYEAVELDDDGNAKNDDDQTTVDTYNDLTSEWTEDCSVYLSKLLAAAKITIYPMPDDVSYNVDMSLATTDSTTDTTDDTTSTDSTSTDESTDEATESTDESADESTDESTDESSDDSTTEGSAKASE